MIAGGLLLASCVNAPLPRVQAQVPRPSPLFAYASARSPGFQQVGRASWYGDELRGQKTANGEPFDPDGFTAAHRTLPLSSYAAVTALDNGKAIFVRINDRGPYHGDRIMDLSLGAARALGMMGNGARLIHIRAVDPSATVRAAMRAGRVMSSPPMDAGALDELRRESGWSPPATTRAEVPAGPGPFFVRVGTFISHHRAESMANNLDADVLAEGGLYQVRLGPYADADKVNAALAPLAAKGYPDVRIAR